MITSLLRFKKAIIVAVLAAGAMDTCSGLLLMLAPALALRLMGVALPVEEALVFIRFIGAFVFSVGSLYFYAGQRFVCRGNAAALCLLLVATAWMRSVIFLFTAVAILSGGLSWAWWTVPLTDGSLALVQVIFVWRVRLEKGVNEHGFTA